jgi:PAS domain S-box-containing protein
VLAAVLQACPSAIVVLGAEERIQVWSAAAERLFGWTAQEVAARPLSRVLGVEASGLLAAARASDGVLAQALVAADREGGSLHLTASCVATRDRNGAPTGVVAVFQDPAAGRDIEQRLVDAQRVEAVGRLAGAIAHDLMNVLSGIKGFAAAAAHELEEDHLVRGDARQIADATDRGAALAQKLLALSLDRASELVAAPPSARPAPTAGRAGETILVVEDDELIRTLTVKLLRRRGYRVLEASTPAEAERHATDEAGAIDLLLSDVGLPNVGGPELARKLATGRPGMKLLFMSGYGRGALAERGLAPGPALIEKPFTPEILLARIRAALDDQNS